MSSFFEGECDTTYPVETFMKLRGKPKIVAEIVRPLETATTREYTGPPRPFRKFVWDNMEVISTKDVVKGVETILRV
jgi:hypothetical protein